MNSQDVVALQEAYLDVYNQEEYLDEGAAGDVAARAQKLANQKKGQTPERKSTYQELAHKARSRQRTQDNPGAGFTRFGREQPYITPQRSQDSSGQETAGGGTYYPGKKRLPKSQKKLDRQVVSGVRAASDQEKQRARGRLGIGENYDLYDIILSHLLDEGYAETQESAERIMSNMSEEWRESILEANAGPSTPVKMDSNMGIVPNQGAGRIKNVRLKPDMINSLPSA